MADPTSPGNRTIVRARKRLALAATRAAFRVLELLAPGPGGRWAESLWFTVPAAERAGRRSDAVHGRPPVAAAAGRRAGDPAGGRRLEVQVPGPDGGRGHTVVGQVWGEGPVVYLQHGWGGRRQQLGALVGPLVAAGHRVVAFDAPSHGESGPGPSGPRRANALEFADALAAVAAATGPAHAVVAHSMGCLATTIALQDGLAAGQVVFVAPMAGIEPYIEPFAGQLGFGPRIRERMVGRTEARIGRPLAAFDVPAIAARLPQPRSALLLVHDTGDPETPWSDSTAIAKAWPGARLVSTTGLGHRRVLRDPAVVAEVAAFVAGVLSPAPGRP
jgi:pimeloyl-ACP methyl ester carboxylesterase